MFESVYWDNFDSPEAGRFSTRCEAFWLLRPLVILFSLAAVSVELNMPFWYGWLPFIALFWK